MGRLFARILELVVLFAKSYALTDSSAAKSIAQREGVGKVRHLDTRALWLQAEVKLGRLSMLKVGTDDNLADIGTKGHDKEKLQRLISLNSLIAMDVEEYPETIAACATSAASSTMDLRAALIAVAVATAAYLPIAEASSQFCINDNSVSHASIFPALLVWALIASLLLNVGRAYVAYHRPLRRSI